MPKQQKWKFDERRHETIFVLILHFFRTSGPQRTDQQSVHRRQTREEDPELHRSLQTDGADLPVPQRFGEVRRHQDRHVPDRGPLGR